jgi:diguanylate cyclase
VVENFEAASATLQKLRWMSVQLAMDDFGTGQSSLSSLSQLHLDILKIDQSFVARLDRDAEGRAITYAIVSLATALGVRVTGEASKRLHNWPRWSSSTASTARASFSAGRSP